MEKNVIRTITINIEAGKASVDSLEKTDLGSIGINLEEFCQKYNSVTRDDLGSIVPVIIYIYDDDTFGFSLEDPIVQKQETPSTTSQSTPSSGGYSSGSGSSRKKKKESVDPDTLVSVNYNSVIASVNDVINSINNTNFLKNDSTYNAQNSNAQIFGTLDKGENYLHSVSSNLLKQMSIGTSNIGTMLNNYSQLDANLASVALGLNDGLSQGQFGSPSATLQLDNSQSFETIAKNSTNLFSEKSVIGKVGKISVSDLKNIMAGKTASLDNEIEDASKLDKSLSNLISSPDIKGSGWDSLRNILENYKGCNQIRSASALKLKEAYEKATKLVSDYIAPDEDIDDSQIPEYVEKIARLESEIQENTNKISSLNSQNSSLAQVKPEAVYEKDEEGKQRFVRYDYTNYNSARAQIDKNNALILEAQGLLDAAKAAKEEATIYLEKLKGLAGIMDQASKIIDDAITDIEGMYASEVYKVDTPRLAKLRDSGVLSTQKPETVKKPVLTSINNNALNSFINKNGTGHTVKMPFVNAKGEKVNITVTCFGPNDTIGVATNDGKNTNTKNVFKKYGADVVMNCALNNAPILVDGKLLQGITGDYLSENASHKGMEALCQKQDGTFVVVPYTTKSDPKGKNFIKRLQQGYVNENGQKENYKFAIGGYYNIVDKSGNFINRNNGYIDKREHPRSMILQTKSGYTYLITADGRTGKTQGTTMKDMYNFAVKNLCDKDDISIYYNGDGGSSTAYQYKGDNGQVVSANHKEWKNKRRVYVYGVSHE